MAYLQGDEPIANELLQGPHALLLSRMIGSTELRSGLSNFLSTPAATKPEEPEPHVPERTLVPEEPEGSEPRVGRLRGRVLLVEDNPVNLMVAQRLVGMLGLNCETADNGEKALERMYAGNLDLVLMDCQMPVKDGYTASREWRLHESATGLTRLPIIAMTANAMAGDRQKCLDAGMDDYLSKPVDRRLLEATIARWLQHRPQHDLDAPLSAPPVRQEPAAAAPPPRPAPPVLPPRPASADMASRPIVPFPPREPAPAPGLATGLPPARPMAPASPPPAVQPEPYSAEIRPDAPPPPPVLASDVVDELRAVMGNEYLSLVRLFLEDAPKHVQALEAAAAGSDMAALVGPAHTLKSASANLGAMALSAAAKRIELGARQGVLPRPAVAVAVLESEYRRAAAAMQGLLKS